MLTNWVRILFGGASYIHTLSPDFIILLNICVRFRIHLHTLTHCSSIIYTTMTIFSAVNSGPPLGVLGKDTDNLNQDTGRTLTCSEIDLMTGTISQRELPRAEIENHDTIIRENTLWACRNEWKSYARNDSQYLEDVSEDEEMLEVPL